jgi:hypothetical protein
LEAPHVGDCLGDSVVVVTAKDIEVGVYGGGGVVCGVFGSAVVGIRGLVFVAIPVVGRVRVMSRRGHMTLLVRVRGVACGGDGCGVWGKGVF